MPILKFSAIRRSETLEYYVEVSIINLCMSFKAIVTFYLHMIIGTGQFPFKKQRISKMVFISRVNDYSFDICPDIWERKNEEI